MYKGGTVKAFKKVLDEMKDVYRYDDEKTRLTLFDGRDFAPNYVGLATVDERTGVEITMAKSIYEDRKEQIC